MVSDGGAVDDHRSFGWVIALADGMRLAHGHRVDAYGHDPRWYCAEGYGAKASAFFMEHVFALEDGGFNFHCNIKDLLKKLV
jgi:hypothetical protein